MRAAFEPYSDYFTIRASPGWLINLVRVDKWKNIAKSFKQFADAFSRWKPNKVSADEMELENRRGG